jgi:hypothetical protein
VKSSIRGIPSLVIVFVTVCETGISNVVIYSVVVISLPVGLTTVSVTVLVTGISVLVVVYSCYTGIPLDDVSNSCVYVTALTSL